MAENRKGLLERLRDLFGNSRAGTLRPGSPLQDRTHIPRDVQDAHPDHEPRGLARGHHKGTEQGPPGLRGRVPGQGRGRNKQ